MPPAELLESGGRMQMLYAWYPQPGRIELRYVGTVPGQVPFAVWSCEPDGPVPSLTEVAPLLSWYEREVTDLFGLTFTEHPQPQRLVLHDGAIVPRPPFSPDYPSGRADVVAQNQQSTPEIAGVDGDVQLLPFGPIRGDVLESAEFLFFYIGEAILHYHAAAVLQAPRHGKAFRRPRARARGRAGGTRLRRRQRGACACVLPSGRNRRRIRGAARARVICAFCWPKWSASITTSTTWATSATRRR